METQTGLCSFSQAILRVWGYYSVDTKLKQEKRAKLMGKALEIKTCLFHPLFYRFKEQKELFVHSSNEKLDRLLYSATNGIICFCHFVVFNTREEKEWGPIQINTGLASLWYRVSLGIRVWYHKWGQEDITAKPNHIIT